MSRRDLLVVMGTVLACVGIVLAAGLTMEPRYTASATLAVGQSSLPANSVTGVPLDRRYYRADQHRETLVDTSARWRKAVAHATARRLGHISATNVAESVRINVRTLNPLIVSVPVTAPSRSAAARLANTFAQEYIRLDRAVFVSKVRRAEMVAALRLEVAGEARASPTYLRRLERQREALGVLSAIGPRPITISRAANAGQTSRSPRLPRDVRVAAVLGLLVGLGLVFFPRALETAEPRRLRTADA